MYVVTLCVAKVDIEADLENHRVLQSSERKHAVNTFFFFFLYLLPSLRLNLEEDFTPSMVAQIYGKSIRTIRKPFDEMLNQAILGRAC